MNVDGTDLTLLYADDYAVDAAWSPDGETIAFAGDDADSTLSILHLAPAEGGTPQPLYIRPYDVWIFSPTWNAAGTRIAFLESEDGDDPWDVRVIEVSTGSITDVATLSMGLSGSSNSTRCLDWARTQDLLLYSAFGKVYALDLNGQSTEIATGGPSSWSPDDSEIVIERNKTLYRHVLDMGSEIEIGEGRYPDWKL